MTREENKLLEFLEKYPNEWHSYARDTDTLCAVEGLHVQIEEMVLSRNTSQMRLNTRGNK